MLTQVTSQQPNVQEATRGRGGSRGRGGRSGRNRGRGRGHAVEGKQESQGEQRSKENGTVDATTAAMATTTLEEEPGEDLVCWICAEPVKYWSVSDCNHRTCHVCALRLRALYKKNDCTFCKEPQRTVIFTASPDAEYSSYKPDDIPFKDAKLSIYFENQEMMEETLILLKFNCPNADCDYIANGWGDLKLHTRAVHGRLMCDLCIRQKKVFSHEHALYPPNVLPVHLPSMHHRHVKQIPKDKVEGGVHPMCEFCNECFFGTDEHYSHMREKHEECFICKRNGVQFQYFQNYDSLERHFNTAHHPCTQPECKERKFVVFNTPLDHQAHMVEEHGAVMSTRDKKDARKVAAEFQFEGVAFGRSRRDGPPRERDREPPPGTPPPRVLSGPSNNRRAAFGASLTDGTSPTPPIHPPPPIHPSPSGTSTLYATDVDPAVAERHSALIARLQSFAPNPTNAVPAFKAAARGYRAAEISSRDLLLTIFNVLANDLDHTASIVNGLVDLLDEEDKKMELLASWQGFRTEQRQQFPDLIPQRLGDGYANIASGRVLNAKHSTATRSSRPSRQVWDRVAAAASSSKPFPPPRKTPQKKIGNYPALPAAASSGTTTTAATSVKPFRQTTRTTPWSASANATASPRTIEPFSVPGSNSSSKSSKAPKLDKSLFPELPSSGSSQEKPKVGGNQSLKNILGSTAPAASAWQANSGSGSGNNSGYNTGEGVEDDVAGGEGEDAGSGKKGKKGKGKQKQTLFTLGSFPSLWKNYLTQLLIPVIPDSEVLPTRLATPIRYKCIYRFLLQVLRRNLKVVRKVLELSSPNRAYDTLRKRRFRTLVSRHTMARSNGRPEPEVIMNFVDGFNYVKARVEDAYRPGGILEKAPPKAPRDPALSTLKREDVDLVVHEFEIPRAQAEKALLQNAGDVGRTIRALITPRSTDFLSNA